MRDGDVISSSTLDDLAPTRRWVAWRNELRGEKSTKVPYSPGGRKAKADDPATWGTRSEAEARARQIVNGQGGGVGIELGNLDHGTSLGGIDLDTCRTADGILEPWATEIIDRFSSYTEISPSQTGAKIFFRYRTADLTILREAMGGPLHGREFKRGNSKDHPPAIELHLSNRLLHCHRTKDR
jgi:putative DNA primase/helicase